MNVPLSCTALLVLSARLAVGTALLKAAIAKARSGADMVKAVEEYRLLPTSLVPIVGRTLVPVEIVLGTALVAGLATRPAALAAAALLTAFGGAIGLNLRHGRVFQCGCGLGGDGPATWWHVVRALALACIAAVAAYRQPGAAWAPAAWPDPLPVLMTLATAVMGGSLISLGRKALFPKEPR